MTLELSTPVIVQGGTQLVQRECVLFPFLYKDCQALSELSAIAASLAVPQTLFTSALEGWSHLP